MKDLLLHCRIQIEETSDVIVYDQRSATADDVTFDSFIYILLRKLVLVFEKVYLLSGNSHFRLLGLIISSKGNSFGKVQGAYI